MALAQLGLELSQTELAKALDIRIGVGTSFSRVERLKQWHIQVEVAEWCGIDRLTSSLERDKAVIAALTTTPGLPGWGDIRTQHTILVVNISSQQITYHDPALANGPITAPRDEFLLAWTEMSELAAFLSLT
jgi:hypothetical protein